jgi:hypothetical protein
MNNLAYKIAIGLVGLATEHKSGCPTNSERHFITRSIPAHHFSQTRSVKNTGAIQLAAERAGVL